MPDYNHGVVTGLNSSLIVIDTERFFLGEQKADGIEVGDTIEWADNGASFLTHLKLLAKKNGGNPTSTTSAAEGTDLKDKLENAGFQNDTSGPADKDKPKISGIYLGNNDTAIMLKIDDKNTPYYATPDLIKYLRSKDCKAKINEAVTLTLEPRPQKLGGGDWATGIGPGSDSPAAEQKTKATDQQQHPPEETTNRQLPSPAAVKPPVAAANVSGPSFRKAVRKSAKLRVGLCGTAGSGKTFTSLLIG
ncbi:hypothetical protein, partial [Methanoregula sp.]|uniref:hypothetical protein n=1 Tax=Methanoregula sp. TaxID=2052170 RepID=UPI000CAC087D